MLSSFASSLGTTSDDDKRVGDSLYYRWSSSSEESSMNMRED